MVHTGTPSWWGKSPGEVSNTAMMSIAGASGIWGGVGHEEEMEEWWLRWWYGEEGTIIGTGLDKEGPSVDEERSSSSAAAWFRAQAEPARLSGFNDGAGLFVPGPDSDIISEQTQHISPATSRIFPRISSKFFLSLIHI